MEFCATDTSYKQFLWYFVNIVFNGQQIYTLTSTGKKGDCLYEVSVCLDGQQCVLWTLKKVLKIWNARNLYWTPWYLNRLNKKVSLLINHLVLIYFNSKNLLFKTAIKFQWIFKSHNDATFTITFAIYIDKTVLSLLYLNSTVIILFEQLTKNILFR